MIGIVVEKTTEAIERHNNDEEAIERHNKLHSAEQLADLLFHLDKDSDDCLSTQELHEGIENPKFVQVLQTLDLPFAFSATELMNMLDNDRSGHLSMHEFIRGVQRLLYCSDFQRDCIHNMQVGMVHKALFQVKSDLEVSIQREIRTAVEEMKDSCQSVSSKGRVHHRY
jgi:hypothetical protein